MSPYRIINILPIYFNYLIFFLSLLTSEFSIFYYNAFAFFKHCAINMSLLYTLYNDFFILYKYHSLAFIK